MLSVRPGRKTDCEAIAAIFNDIIAIGGTTAYESPLAPDYFLQFIDQPDPKVFLHVAEADQQIVGLQWMEPLDPPKNHVGGIATFARPGTAQRGIGSALFATTRSASITAGYTELVAKIRADNHGGLAYYEKMGFRDDHVVPAVPLQDGTPVDRIVKRLML